MWSSTALLRNVTRGIRLGRILWNTYHTARNIISTLMSYKGVIGHTALYLLRTSEALGFVPCRSQWPRTSL
jgi:hypothetical protein